MKNLSTLLQRITQSLGRSEVEKEVVLSCLEKTASLSILPEDISIKGDALEIHASPGKKNLIHMKEAAILRELNACGVRVSRIFYK
jgi:hypothetical protein